MPAAGTARAAGEDLRAAASRRVVPPPDSLPCPGIGNVPCPATPPDTRAEPLLLIHATGRRGRGRGLEGRRCPGRHPSPHVRPIASNMLIFYCRVSAASAGPLPGHRDHER